LLKKRPLLAGCLLEMNSLYRLAITAFKQNVSLLGRVAATWGIGSTALAASDRTIKKTIQRSELSPAPPEENPLVKKV
jgi:hypothetical protein